MTVLQIIQPDIPLWRRPAVRINGFGPELQRLIDDMHDSSLDGDGVGFAGPLVAQSQRIILACLSDDEKGRDRHTEDAGKVYVLANPIIIRRSDVRASGVEGCLSLLGLLGEVERYETIEIAGQDRAGRPIRMKASGWLARVFQHEIDHMDSILYVDKATCIWRPNENEDVVASVAERQ